MLGTIIMAIFFLIAPAGALWLCRKVSWIGKIGPVLLLYVVGIIVGNLFKPQGMAELQDVLSSAAVPLAIPLMLFSCSFRKSETRSQLLALITGIVAVTMAVTAGYLIFGKNIDNGAKIGGMLTGVYTGGTINMAALKTMLNVPDETFVVLNSYDMVISSVTYICSPPFVPMMAAAMKNKRVLASGLAIGVVGYAVGTYLGFLMSGLLGLL